MGVGVVDKEVAVAEVMADIQSFSDKWVVGQFGLGDLDKILYTLTVLAVTVV